MAKANAAVKSVAGARWDVGALGHWGVGAFGGGGVAVAGLEKRFSLCFWTRSLVSGWFLGEQMISDLCEDK